MTRDELDHIYCAWSGKLHRWVKDYLGANINVEYVPQDWIMRMWPGELDMIFGSSGVFRVARPQDYAVMPLPRDGATQEEVDEAFRKLCLIAAQALKINLAKYKLADGPAQTSSGSPPPALDERERPRLGGRKRKRA